MFLCVRPSATVRPLSLPHRFLFDEVYGIEGPIASVLL
jgi:hypothetical protein